MKKLIMLLVILIFGVTVAFYYAKYKISMENQEKLYSQIGSQFEAYKNSLNNMLFFICTKKFSKSDKITLSVDFYKHLKQSVAQFNTAHQDLRLALKQAKANFKKGGDEIHIINNFFQWDKKIVIPTSASEVTRAYCRLYEKEEFLLTIEENIKWYQTSQ